MNIFLKQYRASRGVTLLLALLLAVSVTFGCIGVCAKVSVDEQIETVSEQYITAAIPINDSDDGFPPFWYRLFVSAGREEDGPIPFTRQNAPTPPGLAAEDIRVILGAYVRGTENVTSYELEQYGFLSELYDMYASKLVVLAARCDSVTYSDDSELVYNADFTVLDTLASHNAYSGVPIKAVTCSGLLTKDRTIPYSPGKTYLLFGVDQMSYTIEQRDGKFMYVPDEEQLDSRILRWSLTPMADNGFLFSWDWWIENGYGLTSITSDSLPCRAEYTGSWDEFLSGREGRIWRDTILPMCEKNYAAATVILTDNVNSILAFNNGTASILEGRVISSREYKNGDRVCLVSAAWAKKNGVSVGDTIHMELYEAHVIRATTLTSPVGSMDYATVQEPLKEENRIANDKAYTVVGIYTAPEFSAGVHSFDVNTVFLPKKAVSNAERFEDLTDPALYSAILENGAAEKFEAAMAERGCAGMFEYHDQSYEDAAEAFLAARENAQRLFIIGISAFLLSAALFLFLSFRRMLPAARGLRLLGVKSASVQMDAFTAVAILAAVAVAGGTVLGGALFGMVTDALMSISLELPVRDEVLCGGVFLLFVTAAGFLLAYMMSRRSLMQRK